MKNLLTPPTFDDFLTLLRAWRLWLVGALLGGLLGMAVYAVFPPAYRARAIVMVDLNVEKNFPISPDREIFYYLDRETRQLQEIAWSDAVLQEVSGKNRLSVVDLRSGTLSLSQPGDGGWHFYADSADSGLAAKLARDWALAFSAKAHPEGITITPTQLDNLKTTRTVPLGTYTLAGATLGLVTLAFLSLYWNPKSPDFGKSNVGDV